MSGESFNRKISAEEAVRMVSKESEGESESESKKGEVDRRPAADVSAEEPCSSMEIEHEVVVEAVQLSEEQGSFEVVPEEPLGTSSPIKKKFPPENELRRMMQLSESAIGCQCTFIKYDYRPSETQLPNPINKKLEKLKIIPSRLQSLINKYKKNMKKKNNKVSFHFLCS